MGKMKSKREGHRHLSSNLICQKCYISSFAASSEMVPMTQRRKVKTQTEHLPTVSW